MRLAFMGTPDFSVAALAALIARSHEIAAVYTQPPRPAGRGKKLTPSPVQKFAETQGLTVYSPVSLKNPEEQARFAALGLDAAVVVAYGLILPRPILDAPRLGCLNIHASLLPRWRGAAPIQRAIMAGDTETGIAIMQMDAGLDTGPVILTEKTPISPSDTAGTLHDRLSGMGAQAICAALDLVAHGQARPKPQPEAGVTYAEKIQKSEGRIDWHLDAKALDCHIRGLIPSPGAWFEAEGTRIKVTEAHPLNEPANAAPGTVVEAPLTVACGMGVLKILAVQKEGKAEMPVADFLRGFPLPPGTRLTSETESDAAL